MKIIHIVNQTPTQSVLKLVDEQRKNNEVELVNLESGEPDYDAIIEKVISCDRVISWGNVHKEGVH